MLILSRVCAEFRDESGRFAYEITPRMLHTFQEAPEGIRADPLFQLLINEGSLEAAVPAARRAELENDPVQDTDRTGKRRKDPPAAPANAGKTVKKEADA